MADNLPGEIIVAILTRLPVKDLLRYRCVSKHWCSLIDGPNFIKLHLNHSMEANANLFAILVGDSHLARLDLDALNAAVKLNHPIDDNHKIKFLGSCNGLLALSNSRKDFVICNPSTKRYKKLPIPKFIVPRSMHYQEFYGFGHDCINDDYKLVKITIFANYEGFRFSEVEVYSAKANSWKTISKNFPFLIDLKRPFGLFAGNALHWPVVLEQQSNTLNLIIAIDLVTEEFHEIPPPPEYGKAGITIPFLDVLRGSLWVTYNYAGRPSHADMWVMKEYGVRDSWTKLATLNMIESFMSPVAFLRSGDQIILNQVYERFIMYDLRTKKAKNVRISGLPECFHTRECVGSLVRLSCGWDKENEGGKGSDKDEKKGNKKRDLNEKKRDDFLSKGFKLML